MTHLNKDIKKYIPPVLLNNFNLLNSTDKNNMINTLINIYDKYDYKLGSICYLCHNIIRYHSFEHIDTQYNTNNNIFTAIFYSFPAKAINRSPYDISRHVLMVINNTLLNLTNDYTNNNIKLKIIFNMKDTYPTLNNIRIANNLYYILNNCFMDIIDSIIVINPPPLMFCFTALFSTLFNSKIKVVQTLSNDDYKSCINYL